MKEGLGDFTMSAHGIGSVRQLEPDKPRGKCRKWKLRVRTGLNPRTGKYGERTRNFAGTYREAQAALADFAREVRNEVHTDKRTLTFEQLCDEWVDHRLGLRLISESTAASNRTQLNALCRHVGKMPADKLEPYMLTDAYRALMAGDTPSGRKASGAYVSIAAKTGSTMYTTYAMPKGLAQRNPFDEAARPKADIKERKPLTGEQRAGLVSSLVPGDSHHAAVALALMAGLRIGECCGTDWGMVDLVGGVLAVPGTKNEASKAAVPISGELRAWLLDHEEAQREALAAYGLEQTDETPVCANELGDRVPKHTVSEWWARNRSRLGCGGTHFHDLRHTFATDLARGGAHPKVIQRLMRHRDETMALKVYTHVNVSQMRDALASIDTQK